MATSARAVAGTDLQSKDKVQVKVELTAYDSLLTVFGENKYLKLRDASKVIALMMR